MKKVSVLMSTYKEPVTWVEKSVESIRRQSYDDMEIIIIVDDPTNKQVIEYLNAIKNYDDRIKVFINEENIGLVRSLNRGLKYCEGDYIARMDADDISETNRIEEQVKYIEKCGYDLIGTYMNIFDDNEEKEANRLCVTNWGCKRILKYESTCFHPTWLVKKELYQNLGGYRNIDSCEDYDFIIRAVCNNAKIGNVPKILLNYRDNGESISHKNFNKQCMIADALADVFRRKNTYIRDEHYQKLLKNQIENYSQSQIYILQKKLYCKLIKIIDYNLLRNVEKRR